MHKIYAVLKGFDINLFHGFGFNPTLTMLEENYFDFEQIQSDFGQDQYANQVCLKDFWHIDDDYYGVGLEGMINGDGKCNSYHLLLENETYA